MTSPRFPKIPLPALLAALAAGLTLALFLLARQAEPPEPPTPPPAVEITPEPTPAPTPQPTPASTPEPTPEPTPEANAAPTPPTEDELLGPLPEREDDEEIAAIPTLHEPIPFNVPPPPRITAPAAAQQPHRWPQRVLLRRTVTFPVVLNGRNAGSVQVPAKTPVTLRRVLPDGRLEIGYHQSTTVVPAASTDFLTRLKPEQAPASRSGIVTFPETVLNSSIAPTGTPTPTLRQIPIE